MANATVSPYLNFNGNTKEAMEFYQKALGGKLSLQKFSDAPGMPVPPGYADKIMHARLEADSINIMASEGQPGTEVDLDGDGVGGQPVLGARQHGGEGHGWPLVVMWWRVYRA